MKNAPMRASRTRSRVWAITCRSWAAARPLPASLAPSPTPWPTSIQPMPAASSWEAISAVSASVNLKSMA
jgi:hypothetical protein